MWTRILVLASRVRAWLMGGRLDQEFDDEMQSHLAMLADHYAGRGLTPEEATRRARMRFGGPAQLAEDRRDRRGLPQLETVLQDVRYAWRALGKAPTFTLVAVLTLAIGIGANTTIFSIVRAVLLRPLPYLQPDRLVRIFEANPLKRWTRNVAAPANYADWRRDNTVFTDIAAYNPVDDKGASEFDLFLDTGGEPQRVKALTVSGNLFRVLGVSPLLGRGFTDDETFEGKARVVVISYGAWQSLFGGDPNIVGRTVTLSGRTNDVVGVMPPGFAFPGRDVQVWTPFNYKPSIFVEMRRPHWLNVVGRLRPGISLARAQEEMTAIAARLERAYPDTNTRMGVRLEGFQDSLAYSARSPLLMLLAAVASLFLLVCVNLANLQLGRSAGRAHEIAVRRALGASRGRLVRQLVTEGLVLSVFGGALGFAVAAAGRAALAALSPDAVPIFADVRLDGAVLLFNVALTLLAPVVFGLAPAISSSRADALNERSETVPRRGRSTRDMLVACEVALSIVLAVGAGLLIRSLIRLDQVDPGFAVDRVVTFGVHVPRVRYDTADKELRALEDIERHLRSIPGVQSAGATTTLALHGFSWTGDATVEGRGGDDYERELRHRGVTPSYFQAMGTRLVRGRFFTEFDRDPKAPVAIVNQALAEKYFRGADPVGKRIKYGRPKDPDPWVTVVGVIADEKQDGMHLPAQPEAMSPMAEQPEWASNGVSFVVRTATDPQGTVGACRAEVHRVDKDIALVDVATLQDVVREATGDQRFRTSVLVGFAAVALFLAALGIYGVLAYFVTERAREIGIRLALGAPPARLFGLVVRQGMGPVVVGSVAGVAGAMAATGLMRSLLFGIEPTDGPTYAMTLAVLGSVALCACAIPAIRATRVDPLIALREE